MRSETLETDDGVRLDARIQGPQHPSVMVVWCHPHPLMGGSMSAPLMEAVADRLASDDLGVLRFDFRGVGRSTGTHDGGRAEIRDVSAAVARARDLAPRVTVAGWSFGAMVAMHHALGSERAHHYVAIAPPIESPERFDSLDGNGLTLVLGTRDFVVDNDAIEDLARSSGAGLVRLTTDHLFMGHAGRLTAVIVDATNRTM